MLYKEKNVFLSTEIKNHPYFHGVDWDGVAARESEPPYEPSEYQFNLEHPIDLATKLEIDADNELDPSVAEQFQSRLKLVLSR